MLTGIREAVARYKDRGEDLEIDAELIIVGDLFSVHKNLLEICRSWHRGREVARAALDDDLDSLLTCVLVLGILARERYND